METLDFFYLKGILGALGSRPFGPRGALSVGGGRDTTLANHFSRVLFCWETNGCTQQRELLDGLRSSRVPLVGQLTDPNPLTMPLWGASAVCCCTQAIGLLSAAVSVKAKGTAVK